MPALDAYVKRQQEKHAHLSCHLVGFVIDSRLGVSPDGLMYDPYCSPQHGLLEIKCPYVAHNGMSAQEYAAKEKD